MSASRYGLTSLQLREMWKERVHRDCGPVREGSRHRRSTPADLSGLLLRNISRQIKRSIFTGTIVQAGDCREMTGSRVIIPKFAGSR